MNTALKDANICRGHKYCPIEHVGPERVPQTDGELDTNLAVLETDDEQLISNSLVSVSPSLAGMRLLTEPRR